MSFWPFCCKPPQAYPIRFFSGLDRQFGDYSSQSGYAVGVESLAIPGSHSGRIVGSPLKFKSVSEIAGVTEDGELYVWHGGAYDAIVTQLGGGSYGPLQVGEDTDWDSVASNQGADAVLAKKTDGSLWYFGRHQQVGVEGSGSGPRREAFRAKISSGIDRIESEGFLALPVWFTQDPATSPTIVKTKWSRDVFPKTDEVSIAPGEPGGGALLTADFKAAIDDGAITEISVTSGGQNYPPNQRITVSFVGHEDSGGGASAFAESNAAGQIVSVTITNPGSGYKHPVLATVPGNGSASLEVGPPKRIRVLYGGRYRSTPTVSTTPAAGDTARDGLPSLAVTEMTRVGVERFDLVSGGSGYTTATAVETKTGATANGIIVNGSVVSWAIVSSGNPVHSPLDETPLDVQIQGDGNGAAATAVPLPSSVLEVTAIDNPETWRVPPLVGFSEGVLGETAVARVEGVIGRVFCEVAHPGGGYTRRTSGQGFTEVEFMPCAAIPASGEIVGGRIVGGNVLVGEARLIPGPVVAVDASHEYINARTTGYGQQEYRNAIDALGAGSGSYKVLPFSIPVPTNTGMPYEGLLLNQGYVENCVTAELRSTSGQSVPLEVRFDGGLPYITYAGGGFFGSYPECYVSFFAPPHGDTLDFGLYRSFWGGIVDGAIYGPVPAPGRPARLLYELFLREDRKPIAGAPDWHQGRHYSGDIVATSALADVSMTIQPVGHDLFIKSNISALGLPTDAGDGDQITVEFEQYTGKVLEHPVDVSQWIEKPSSPARVYAIFDGCMTAGVFEVVAAGAGKAIALSRVVGAESSGLYDEEPRSALSPSGDIFPVRVLNAVQTFGIKGTGSGARLFAVDAQGAKWWGEGSATPTPLGATLRLSVSGFAYGYENTEPWGVISELVRQHRIVGPGNSSRRPGDIVIDHVRRGEKQAGELMRWNVSGYVEVGQGAVGYGNGVAVDVGPIASQFGELTINSAVGPSINGVVSGGEFLRNTEGSLLQSESPNSSARESLLPCVQSEVTWALDTDPRRFYNERDFGRDSWSAEETGFSSVATKKYAVVVRYPGQGGSGSGGLNLGRNPDWYYQSGGRDAFIRVSGGKVKTGSKRERIIRERYLVSLVVPDVPWAYHIGTTIYRESASQASLVADGQVIAEGIVVVWSQPVAVSQSWGNVRDGLIPPDYYLLGWQMTDAARDMSYEVETVPGGPFSYPSYTFLDGSLAAPGTEGLGDSVVTAQPRLIGKVVVYEDVVVDFGMTEIACRVVPGAGLSIADPDISYSGIYVLGYEFTEPPSIEVFGCDDAVVELVECASSDFSDDFFPPLTDDQLSTTVSPSSTLACDPSGRLSVICRGPLRRAFLTQSPALAGFGGVTGIADHIVRTSDGALWSVTVTERGFVNNVTPGLYYSSAASGAVVLPPRVIAPASVSLTHGGRGYQLPADVAITQPEGIALGQVTIDGRIVAVGIVEPGTGYHAPPVSDAATVEIAGPLASVSVTSGGSGYVVPPRVRTRPDCGAALSAKLLNGSVQSVEITREGRYRVAPEVVFEPVATVASIQVLSGGDEYRTPPRVLIVGGGCDTPATAAAEIVGPVVRVDVANGGSGYLTPPLVEFEGDGEGATATARILGPVTHVAITSPGAGYSELSPPSVVFVGNGGGAAGNAIVANGRIVGVQVTSGGEYFGQPSVFFTGASSRPASAEAFIDGKVDEVVVETGGQYSRAPEVRFVGGLGPAGAAAAAFSVINGSVRSVSILGVGYGYTSTPRVVFTGGGGKDATASATIHSRGSGAAATATIDGSVVSAIAFESSSQGNLQTSPVVACQRVDASEGTDASLQAVVLGRPTGVSVNFGGSGYRKPRLDSDSDVVLHGQSAIVRTPVAFACGSYCNERADRTLFSERTVPLMPSHKPAGSGLVKLSPLLGMANISGDAVVSVDLPSCVVSLRVESGGSGYTPRSALAVVIASTGVLDDRFRLWWQGTQTPRVGDQVGVALVDENGSVVAFRQRAPWPPRAIVGGYFAYTSPPTYRVAASQGSGAVIVPEMGHPLECYHAPQALFDGHAEVDADTQMTLAGAAVEQRLPIRQFCTGQGASRAPFWVGLVAAEDATQLFRGDDAESAFVLDLASTVDDTIIWLSLRGRVRGFTVIAAFQNDSGLWQFDGYGSLTFREAIALRQERGLGYYDPPPVATLEDERGNGATLSALPAGRLNYQSLSQLTVTDFGSGYTFATRFRLRGGTPIAWSNPATATAVIGEVGSVDEGSVVGITVDAPGLGYSTPPTVIIDGDGVGATAVVDLTSISDLDGSILAIRVTAGGERYTKARVIIVDNEKPADTNPLIETLHSAIDKSHSVVLDQCIVESATLTNPVGQHTANRMYAVGDARSPYRIRPFDTLAQDALFGAGVRLHPVFHPTGDVNYVRLAGHFGNQMANPQVAVTPAGGQPPSSSATVIATRPLCDNTFSNAVANVINGGADLG